MAHPHHHAISSSRKFGGAPEDYLAIHQWFDESKAHHADFRHRALRHHAEGIFLMESIFGVTIPVRILRCPAGGDPAGCGSTNISLGDDGMYDCLDCGLFFTPKTKQVPTRPIGEQHVKEDLGWIPPATAWLKQIQAEPWMNRSRQLSRELEEGRV
jgi:hypothetical protein